MEEQEYLQAQDLTKLRIARGQLKELLPTFDYNLSMRGNIVKSIQLLDECIESMYNDLKIK